MDQKSKTLVATGNVKSILVAAKSGSCLIRKPFAHSGEGSGWEKYTEFAAKYSKQYGSSAGSVQVPRVSGIVEVN